jgi:hypothetical protein
MKIADAVVLYYCNHCSLFTIAYADIELILSFVHVDLLYQRMRYVYTIHTEKVLEGHPMSIPQNFTQDG